MRVPKMKNSLAIDLDRTACFSNEKLDSVAQSLLPEEYGHLIPVKCTGDGNCLYNAMSILISGDESLSDYLRKESSKELQTNSEHYAKYIKYHIECNNQNGIFDDETLFHSMLSEDTVKIYENVKKDKIKLLQIEADLSIVSGRWSTFINLFPLSTVSRRNLCSVYPTKNPPLRSVYNSTITSRCKTTQPDAHILWSRDGMLEKGMYTPNHFVPLLPLTLPTVLDLDDSFDEILSQLDLANVTMDSSISLLTPDISVSNTDLAQQDMTNIHEENNKIQKPNEDQTVQHERINTGDESSTEDQTVQHERIKTQNENSTEDRPVQHEHINTEDESSTEDPTVQHEHINTEDESSTEDPTVQHKRINTEDGSSTEHQTVQHERISTEDESSNEHQTVQHERINTEDENSTEHQTVQHENIITQDEGSTDDQTVQHEHINTEDGSSTEDEPVQHKRINTQDASSTEDQNVQHEHISTQNENSTEDPTVQHERINTEDESSTEDPTVQLEYINAEDESSNEHQTVQHERINTEDESSTEHQTVQHERINTEDESSTKDQTVQHERINTEDESSTEHQTVQHERINTEDESSTKDQTVQHERINTEDESSSKDQTVQHERINTQDESSTEDQTVQHERINTEDGSSTKNQTVQHEHISTQNENSTEHQTVQHENINTQDEGSTDDQTVQHEHINTEDGNSTEDQPVPHKRINTQDASSTEDQNVQHEPISTQNENSTEDPTVQHEHINTEDESSNEHQTVQHERINTEDESSTEHQTVQHERINTQDESSTDDQTIQHEPINNQHESSTEDPTVQLKRINIQDESSTDDQTVQHECNNTQDESSTEDQTVQRERNNTKDESSTGDPTVQHNRFNTQDESSTRYLTVQLERINTVDECSTDDQTLQDGCINAQNENFTEVKRLKKKRISIQDTKTKKKLFKSVTKSVRNNCNTKVKENKDINVASVFKKGQKRQISENDCSLDILAKALKRKKTILNDTRNGLESSDNDSDISLDSDIECVQSDDDDDDDDPAETFTDSLTWKSKCFPMKKPKFAGPAPGVSKDFVLDKDAKELDFFFSFFPEAMLSEMAKNANKYVPIYSTLHSKSSDDPYIDKDFKPITGSDIRAFFTCRMVMGVTKLPHTDDYWSTDPAMRNNYISRILSRSKYRQVNRYFHINDPTKDPARLTNRKAKTEGMANDPLYKIRPLLDSIRAQCLKLYNLNQEISVDEAMIKFHGQHFGTIGAPHKPAKRWFRIFALADGHNGYFSNFEVYLRKKEKEVGLTTRVVEDLARPFYNRQHIIFVDKFYTSTNLALSLLNKGTQLNGSFNKARKNWPEDLKPNCSVRKKVDPVRTLERGQCMYRQTENGKLVACIWKDSSLVYNLNTCYNINVKITNVKRKTRLNGAWIVDDLPCPEPIKEFNRFMGGVDQHDHLRSSYTVQRKAKKWWHYFTWFAIDISLINAYILWKLTHKGTHKNFQLEVAKQLSGEFTRTNRQNQERDIGPQAEGHTRTVFKGRPRICLQCKREGKKTQRGRCPETPLGCLECGVHVHKQCFIAFHKGECYRSKSKIINFDKSTQCPEEEKHDQESFDQIHTDFPVEKKDHVNDKHQRSKRVHTDAALEPNERQKRSKRGRKKKL